MNPPTPAVDADSPAARKERQGEALLFHPLSYGLGLLTALLLVGGALLLLRRPEPPPIALQPPPTPAPTATPFPSPTPAPITVFVSGAVARPGLYSLTADGRVGDAVALAGGLAQGANEAVVNQAELLWDGAQIHIPDTVAGTETPANPMSNGPAAGVSGSGPDGGRSAVVNLGDGLIDLNQATVAALETLPGIGPSKAAAILANRPYADVDDLVRVPGIGEKTIEQLRAYVTVQ